MLGEYVAPWFIVVVLEFVAYHLSVPPVQPEALKFTVPEPQRLSPVVDGAPGTWLTVAVTDARGPSHPLELVHDT